MIVSEKAKHLNAPNAPDAQTLPFGGKFAAVLLLLVAAAALILAALSVRCSFMSEIPLLGCSWKESTGDGIKNAKAAVFAVGCVVFIWLALSVAVFVWRWADGLLFGGKWAIVSLAAIIVGESVITEFWQGYVNSFGKVTDKLVWVLLLWFVVAWRGKSVMDWVTRSLQEAAEKPVKAVKESVDGAAQTMKTAADDITKGLHENAEATADAAKKAVESITSSVADISEKTAASVAKGVTGAYATMGEHANTAVEVVSDTAGAATDKLKSVVGMGGDKPADSEDDKQAEEDASETKAEEEGKGILQRAQEWLSGSDEDGEELPSIGKSPLHEAAESGDADAVKRLLDKEGNPNQTNDAGQSPLHLAAKAGHADVVDVLVGARADVAARDKDGNTAEDVAKKERGKDDTIAAHLSKAAKG